MDFSKISNGKNGKESGGEGREGKKTLWRKFQDGEHLRIQSKSWGVALTLRNVPVIGFCIPELASWKQETRIPFIKHLVCPGPVLAT